MTSLNDLKSRTAHLPPIDGDVQLPAAIRAAAQRASELHVAAYQESAVTEQKASEEAKNDDVPVVENGNREEETPEAEKATQGAREETTPSTPEDWEHKYNSLKGRYDRQDGTIRGLNARIGHLETLLASTATAKAAEQPPSEMNFRKLTDKDREDFGDDFLDASARAAEERLGPYIRKLEDQVRHLGGTVQNVTLNSEQRSQAAMYAFLDDKLPDWRTINRDQRFIAWCNLQDGYSGDIRMNMLRDAYQKSDGDRVLRFFQGFLKDEATADPANKGKPELPATPAKGKVSLSEFAAPGRAKAPAATDVPGEKETITHAQIAAFYSDVHKGKYRGNEAEKNRLEQMIFTAQAEGRVT